MTNTPCPECGHEATTDATACPNCGQALTNGSVPHRKGSVQKPPPPPEAADWVIYPTPPEIREEMQRTFNEEEFLAQLREAERACLPELKDLIRDLEQEMSSRD